VFVGAIDFHGVSSIKVKAVAPVFYGIRPQKASRVFNSMVSTYSTTVMENISLQLSLDEINVILGSLGNQPYVQVFGLVQKIQQQASAQLPAQSNGQALAQPVAEN
jgi:hypothetical protein